MFAGGVCLTVLLRSHLVKHPRMPLLQTSAHQVTGQLTTERTGLLLYVFPL